MIGRSPRSISVSAANNPAGPAPTTTAGGAPRTSRRAGGGAGSARNGSSIHTRTRSRHTGVPLRASSERLTTTWCVIALAATPSRCARRVVRSVTSSYASGGSRISVSAITVTTGLSAQTVTVPDVVAEQLRACARGQLSRQLLHLGDVVTGVIGVRKVRGPEEPGRAVQVHERRDGSLVGIAGDPALAAEVAA